MPVVVCPLVGSLRSFLANPSRVPDWGPTWTGSLTRATVFDDADDAVRFVKSVHGDDFARMVRCVDLVEVILLDEAALWPS